MVTLIVAEKPSVAKDIARIVGAKTRGEVCFYGNGYRVTWCIGHLLEICEPHEYDGKWKRWSLAHLPILPDSFLYRPITKTKAHLLALTQHFRGSDVGEIINACDAGREGELIFRLVEDYAKVHKPIKRLWISSLTDAAIRAGLQALKPSVHFDALGDAARCRAEADWLIGMNATRAMTLVARNAGVADTLFSIGRVQTPTLALLVDRENVIRAFVPESFWSLTAQFRPLSYQSTDKDYRGVWFRDKVNRFSTEEDARQVADLVRNTTGVISSVDTEDVRERPPLLFDLTELQRVVNRRFGLSAKHTLEVAQRLYEHHKLITYPRTDSRYLTSDQRDQIPILVHKLTETEFSPLVEVMKRDHRLDLKRVIDNSEVTDHHAIIPTGITGRTNGLDRDESRVFELIVRRFLAAQMNDARFSRTCIITEVAQHTFRSVGKVRLAAGWHALEPPPTKAPDKRSDGSDDEDQPLPELRANQDVLCHATEVRKGETTPPKRFTEATLLTAMERAGQEIAEEELRKAMKDSGLGTPATRAPIIETLLQREYIERDGKMLVPTDLGCQLIAALPVTALRSAQLTGAWEADLARIARREVPRSQFMTGIANYAREMIVQFVGSSPPQPFAKLAEQGAEILGTCPLCKRDVRRQRQGYTCDGAPECPTKIPRQIAAKPITKPMVQQLLTRGRTVIIPGFRSAAGKTFSAALVLQPEGDIGFTFDNPSPTKTRGRSFTNHQAEVSSEPPTCPLCQQGTIIRGRQAWGCARWREGCTFVIPYEHNAIQVPEIQAFTMIRFGTSARIPKLCGRSGGKLVLDLNGPPFVRIEKATAVNLRKPPPTYTKRTVKGKSRTKKR